MTTMFNCSIIIYKSAYTAITPTIDSVLRSKELKSLFLINNSPTDEISQYINNNRIKYIYNKKNLGFGAAHNTALQITINEGTPYHLVLNPDVIFDPAIMLPIIEYMDDNTDAGLLMPKIYYPDGSIQYLCKLLPTPFDWIFRRFLPVKKLFKKQNEIFELHFSGYNKIMNIPNLSGAFMFIRTNVLKEIGLFDEKFFLYCEDTDLARRLHKRYKTIYYPDVSVTHEHQKGSYKSFKLLWIHIKSAIYYFNKWGWFIDKERKEINQRALSNLGFKRSGNYSTNASST